jgi:chromosome partitioning protein
MAIFAFIHHKGGTGKTTACLQSAGFLKQAHKRVLVIDIDPQANATLGLGVLPHEVPVTMYHVFLAACTHHDPVPLECAIVSTRSGIDLAPSNLDLIGAEPYLYQYPERYSILRSEILRMEDKYDYILIDTPPFLGQFVLNAIIAAEYPVFVFSPDIFAMAGYENMKVVCGDIKEILGKEVIPHIAVLNRWGVANNTSSGFFSSLKNKLLSKTTLPGNAPPVGDTPDISSLVHDFPHIVTVPASAIVSTSYQSGMPLVFTHPNDPAAQAYSVLAEVMMQCP